MNLIWMGVKVSVPKGAFCQLKSEFTVGIPPDALFDILIDPENKRVFKDIQVGYVDQTARRRWEVPVSV